MRDVERGFVGAIPPNSDKKERTARKPVRTARKALNNKLEKVL